MKLQDLVNNPDLGIRALHGDSAALAKPVGWTYTTDLPNPSPYLSRGLLVMTAMMWRHTEADSEAFVTTLVEAGAIGMVAGEGLLGYVPDDVVGACQRHNLPLLAVSPKVSFVDITEFLTRSLTSDRVTRLTSTLVRHRQLLAEVAAGQALDEVVHEVSREAGLRCWVVTPTGRQVVSSNGQLSDLDLDELTSVALSSRRLPATVLGHDGETYSVFEVPGSGESRATGWFLVVQGEYGGWSLHLLDAISELAAIAALDKARIEGGSEAWQEIADAALRLIARDGNAADVEAQLRQLGLGSMRPLIVISAAMDGPVDKNDEARWLLTDAVAQVCTPMVGVEAKGDAIALVPVDAQHRPERTIATIERALRRAGPGLTERRLLVGVSGPTNVAALAGTIRSARYARNLAADTRKPVEVVLSSQVNSALVLLNAVPDELRRTFAEHVLQPVIDYDARGTGDLLLTLRTFFDSAGSWSKTADRLDLHLNTVRYRIARVEHLTGRDLGDMEDRTDLFLALHLL